MIPNYYAALGVKPDASTMEIKRAYRRLARLHHPDVNAVSEDAQIKRLNEAYAVLSNPQKRATYTMRLREEQLRLEVARRQRELLRRQQEEAQREPRMTWMEGMFGFVRELKKGMRDD